MHEFLIGEWVERRRDGAVGVVREIISYNEEPLYRVEFQRGNVENFVWGTEEAWQRHHKVHAHVARSSADCDGKYESARVDEMVSEERAHWAGDLRFKGRVLGGVVSFHMHGSVSVSPDGFEWHCDTDEGYEHVEVEWCEDAECDRRPSFRDFSAERTGY